MKQFDKLKPGDLTSAAEDVSKRQPNSKEFDLGNGKRRIVSSVGQLHYEDGGAQKDIDLTPVDLGDRWRIDQAPYIIEIRKDRLEFTYTSRKGGSVTVSASDIGGTPRLSPVVAEGSVGSRIRFDNVRPGLDIYFEFRPNTVRIFKILKSPAAPTQFTWDIEEDENAAFTVLSTLIGRDSKTSSPFSRNLELSRAVGPVSTVGGVKFYQVTETFHGRVSEIVDASTRRREWKTDLVYPLVIDPDITENITDTDDDAWSQNSHTFTVSYTWIKIGTAYGIFREDGGFRFQTIAIGNADTIDLANLILEVTAVTNTPELRIWADDVDDAPAFTSSDRMKDMTKTTASTNWDPTSTGSNTVAVTSIVQEIVDRGGWASGQDIRFAIGDDGAGGTNWIKVDDFTTTDGTPAVLEIDFTAGGASPTINLVTAPYLPA